MNKIIRTYLDYQERKLTNINKVKNTQSEIYLKRAKNGVKELKIKGLADYTILRIVQVICITIIILVWLIFGG